MRWPFSLYKTFKKDVQGSHTHLASHLKGEEISNRCRRNSPDGGTGGVPQLLKIPLSLGDTGGWIKCRLNPVDEKVVQM